MENDLGNARLSEELTEAGGKSTGTDTERVLDPKKVEDCISKLFQVFSMLGLTVAETIQAVESVRYVLKERYAGVYMLIAEAKRVQSENSDDNPA